MDQAEQQGFHGQQWWQPGQQRRNAAAVQPLFGGRHEQGMQRGEGEQAVGQHRHQEVQAERHRAGIGQHVGLGKQRRKDRGNGSGRQADDLQTLHASVETLDPVKRNGQPEHHGKGNRKAEAHAAAIENLHAQADAMCRQRHQKEAAFAEPESARRLVQQGSAPARAPKMYREAGIQGCGQQMH